MAAALSDNEVHDRLVEALRALGTEPGATARGNTAIEAARRGLALLASVHARASILAEVREDRGSRG